MPSKSESDIKNYLSDKKGKLAEYQRREGTNSLANKNFQFIVHSVSPGASHRTIEVKVTSNPTLSSLKHLENTTMAIVKIPVDAGPSGDEIESWLIQSYKKRSEEVTINMLPYGGWGPA